MISFLMRSAALSLMLVGAANAEIIAGKVIKVADGDTVTIVSNSKQYKIRLAGIDTPEKTQPYFSQAKQFTSSQVFNKQVKADVRDKDRYGRYVADVYYGDKWLNLELVKVGAAHVYERYTNDPHLFNAQAVAKNNKKGIWSLPASQQTPPWEFRRNKRSN